MAKDGLNKAKSCPIDASQSYPRVAPESLRVAQTCIKGVTKTFPNLFHHFGHDFHERVTDQWTDRRTDRWTDTTSYRDARTHLKIMHDGPTYGWTDLWTDRPTDGHTYRDARTHLKIIKSLGFFLDCYLGKKKWFPKISVFY